MKSEARVRALMLPGLGNSGPRHWQTLWERDPVFRRVAQSEWERPRCETWVCALENAVDRAGDDVVLVAHSLGCLLVAQWAARHPRVLRGALLVAPPDPDAITFPADAAVGFDPLPHERLPFPSIVVASADDPFGSVEFTRRCSEQWGSRFVVIGARGHINAESGLGAWEEGLGLLRELSG